jgi:dolichyl-phosphate-mannose--protein O-mannosyl transferase
MNRIPGTGMRRFILILSVTVVIMTMIIRREEEIPLWFMITAVVLACIDGVCVMIETHRHQAYCRKLQKEKEKHL